MSLIIYKWLAATLITLITLISGFASLHFIRRYQRFLQIGDALADGIFLGAAAFHLFPNTLEGLSGHFDLLNTYLIALLFVFCGFLLLYLSERLLIYHEPEHKRPVNMSAWMLAGILSIHAFIAGAALGISDTIASVSILFIAILAHKGFESFALALELHRNWHKSYKTKITLFFFAFVTPLGIVLASMIERLFTTQTANLITCLFSSFAAGSFIYIGTLHMGHDHFHPHMDTSSRYYKMLLTIAGMVAMGVIAIWA